MLPRFAVATILVVATAGLPPAMAEDAPLIVTLAGEKEISLTPQALRALPSTSVEVTFQTSKGVETSRYTGSSLWQLLAEGGFIEADAHKGMLRRILVITASDGYAVVLSAGELAPEFGATPVLLAYQRDGADIPADKAPRLIVPGDRRGGRNVVDVVRIDVRTVER